VGEEIALGTMSGCNVAEGEREERAARLAGETDVIP
jgi:hypothetical protein